MNKTIKVIELLNKIANGEEVPKRVKYNGITYSYRPLNKQGLKYADAEGSAFYNYLTGVVNNLNEEVEIIEESNKIDIQAIEEIIDYRTSEDDLYNDNFGDFKSTINELVRAVKQLDRKYKGE